MAVQAQRISVDNLDDFKDRRSFDRLAFSEITTCMYNHHWNYLLKNKLLRTIFVQMTGKSSLFNLSSSGSCIISKSTLKLGHAVCLIINIPGEKSISVKGTVSWISPEVLADGSYIGIQFLAFSNWKRYNSYKILGQLRRFAIQNDPLIVLAEDMKRISQLTTH